MSNIQKGYKQTDVGVIPEDWDVRSISSVAEIATGNTPPTRDLNNYGDEYLFVGPADLGKRKWIFNSEKKLSRKGFNISRKFPPKSILFTCIGSTIGKSGMASILLTSNQQINAVLPNENYHSDFLFYALNLLSPKIKSLAGEQAVPLVNKTQFGETLVPLPPTKSEQTAIASALSDADALITSLEKLIEKKRAIKQGAMQQLFVPKEDWALRSYGEVFSFLNTANYSRAQLSESDEIKCIHYGDIHTRWNIHLDILNNILPSIKDEQLKNYHLIKEGDIIMADASEDYDGIGKSVEVRNVGNLKGISGLHTFLLRDVNNVFVDGFRGYIHLINTVKKQFDELATGMKVYGVSKVRLKTVLIPIPPIADQYRITQILSEMDAEITALDKKLSKYKSLKQGMMQELLTGKIRLVDYERIVNTSEIDSIEMNN